MADAVQIVVGVGRMTVRRPLLLPRRRNGQVRARNAAFHAFLQGKGHVQQAQSVQPLHKTGRVRQQLQQRRRQHISRRTHAAVQIQYLHGFASM